MVWVGQSVEMFIYPSPLADSMDKTLIQALKNDHRVIAAYLFGSHGSPRQTPLSDIDICLFTRDLLPKTKLELLSFGSEKIDISLFDTLPIYIKPEVFRGKPLFVKDKLFVAEKFAISFRGYQDFKRYQRRYWSALRKRTLRNEKNKAVR